MARERILTACVERAEHFQRGIAALFQRLPMLCGFHVTDGLEVTHLTLDGWPGRAARCELADEIRAGLKELVIEAPKDTAALMRGKTFARVFH